MPVYEYRCQDCRTTFGEERSMNEISQPACSNCQGANVNRIWNAHIRAGAVKADVGQSAASRSAGSGGGCSTGSSHSCGSCH